jgi:hypothetical protein
MSDAQVFLMGFAIGFFLVALLVEMLNEDYQ